MSVETFKITVKNVRQGAPENIVVADAMKYLASAEHVREIMRRGEIQAVKTNITWVTIMVEAPIVGNAEMRTFISQIQDLDRVETIKKRNVAEN